MWEGEHFIISKWKLVFQEACILGTFFFTKCLCIGRASLLHLISLSPSLDLVLPICFFEVVILLTPHLLQCDEKAVRGYNWEEFLPSAERVSETSPYLSHERMSVTERDWLKSTALSFLFSWRILWKPGENSTPRLLHLMHYLSFFHD